MKTGIKKNIKSFAYGLIFGFGSPIPGVSAGTMAILLNVYDKFFSSISMEYAKKNVVSIITFLLGWAVGLFGISSIMVFLFYNHVQVISFIFIGLILGCVPMIYKKATVDKVKIKNVIIFFTAFAFMAFVAIFGGDLNIYNAEHINTITPYFLVWIFFASFVSSIAMLIPGVGGSLMMIVFGIYTIYLEAVATIDIVLLITFVVSMILGVVVGIVLTKKMLDYFAQTLYFAILGFIMGSIIILYPGFYMGVGGLLSVVLGCLCFYGAYWMSKKES